MADYSCFKPSHARTLTASPKAQMTPAHSLSGYPRLIQDRWLSSGFSQFQSDIQAYLHCSHLRSRHWDHPHSRLRPEEAEEGRQSQVAQAEGVRNHLRHHRMVGKVPARGEGVRRSRHRMAALPYDRSRQAAGRSSHRRSCRHHRQIHHRGHAPSPCLCLHDESVSGRGRVPARLPSG